MPVICENVDATRHEAKTVRSNFLAISEMPIDEDVVNGKRRWYTFERDALEVGLCILKTGSLQFFNVISRQGYFYYMIFFVAQCRQNKIDLGSLQILTSLPRIMYDLQ